MIEVNGHNGKPVTCVSRLRIQPYKTSIVINGITIIVKKSNKFEGTTWGFYVYSIKLIGKLEEI